MSRTLSRRGFLTLGATAAVAPLLAKARSAPDAPSVVTPRAARPLVISSKNGNEFKNGGPRTAVEEAFERIAHGGDVLEAIVAGVSILELDPAEDSVGYGGIPNADGVIQLDACVMHGTRKRAGGVAALEGVRTPSRVALAVMQTTDHHLLVGAGAQAFAQRMGFKIEDDLNTENSRSKWLEWKRRTDPLHYLSPKDRQTAYHNVAMDMIAEGLIDRDHYYGTINCDGVNAKGEICGVTTTSGLAWKIPGRAGDSPILGAGLYVDGEVGAAGSTGRGEANLYNLSSFQIVDEMRRGAKPKDACITVLKRIAKNTIEKRLLTDNGQPNFGLNFYCLNNKGEFAGVSMYDSTFAVCTENGAQTLKTDSLFGKESPDGRR